MDSSNPSSQHETVSNEPAIRSTGGHAEDRTLPHGWGDPIHQAGLHVRCPHCRSPIEVVPDAELDSILCSACGSEFSLIGDDDTTRAASGVTRVAQFKLVERVGVGAFGAVWKAFDTKLDRTVAVKIPRRGQFDSKQEKAFLREAQNTAQLNHPSIVPVYEVGRDGETLFIVSEFVRGVTLADNLSAGLPSMKEAALLCARIADALHHAHNRGVIHRDLKPGNIMLDDAGEPHLMDFGLAKRDAAEVTVSLDGQIIGTPAYMSPEQAAGDAHNADARSDLYSLGVILFELLTGERPFRGNARMLIHQVINDEPPSPRKLNPVVPRDLETIALNCLNKSPDRRFESAAEIASELRLWAAGKPIRTRPVNPVVRAWKWVRQDRTAGRVAVAAMIAIILVQTAFIALSFYLGRDAMVQRRVAKAAQQEALKATQLAEHRQVEAQKALAESLVAIEQAEEAKLEAAVATRQALESKRAAQEARIIAETAVDAARMAEAQRDEAVELAAKAEEQRKLAEQAAEEAKQSVQDSR